MDTNQSTKALLPLLSVGSKLGKLAQLPVGPLWAISFLLTSDAFDFCSLAIILLLDPALDNGQRVSRQIGQYGERGTVGRWCGYRGPCRSRDFFWLRRTAALKEGFRPRIEIHTVEGREKSLLPAQTVSEWFVEGCLSSRQSSRHLDDWPVGQSSCQ